MLIEVFLQTENWVFHRSRFHRFRPGLEVRGGRWNIHRSRSVTLTTTRGTAFQATFCWFFGISLTAVTVFRSPQPFPGKRYKHCHDTASIRLSRLCLNSNDGIVGPVTEIFKAPIFTAYPLLVGALIELTTSLPDVKPMFWNPDGPGSKYVSRPVLEKKIERIYSEPLSEKVGTYAVVAGPTGGGKSSVVAHSLGDKRGVIHILISRAYTWSTLFVELLRQRGEVVEGNTGAGYEVLLPVLREASKRRGGISVTFVLDVVTDSRDVLESVKVNDCTVYHLPSRFNREYRLATRALKAAILLYELTQ